MRLLGRLSFLALVVPLLDLFLLVQLAGWIGGGPTFLLVLASAAAGVWLIRRAGSGVLQRLQTPIAAGPAPGRELFDRTVTFFSGVLLIVPGVITSVLGLVAVLPPSRMLLRRVIEGWTRGAVASGRLHVMSTMTGPLSSYAAPRAPEPAPGIEEAEVIEVRNLRGRDAA
jgi:UPF0716 family protein affecting phage T7 exclusion